jgi:hypothetical protein
MLGTGFHSELMGRENVFLNNAILGNARSETARKFDEIVALPKSKNSSTPRRLPGVSRRMFGSRSGRGAIAN